jgi:hypothetical protein
MIAVGLLIVTLSVVQLFRALRAIWHRPRLSDFVNYAVAPWLFA